MQTLLVALSLTACDASVDGVPPPSEGRYAFRCGTAGNTIDTRHLIGLLEQEAVEFGRRHGCAVRVAVRDRKVVAATDRNRRRTTIAVTIRDG